MKRFVKELKQAIAFSLALLVVGRQKLLIKEVRTKNAA